MGWSEAELSLTLVSDRAMAALNRETFGRRGPTNVIAFPLDAAPEAAAGTPPAAGRRRPTVRARPAAGPQPMLGEVVISVETTRRQAEEFAWPWEELLDFFLIHGILHLVGYDHGEPRAEKRMNARARKLMALLHPRMEHLDREI